MSCVRHVKHMNIAIADLKTHPYLHVSVSDFDYINLYSVAGKIKNNKPTHCHTQYAPALLKNNPNRA